MIKIKLNEGQFIEMLQDMLLFLICIVSLFLAAGFSELKEQNEEIKARYEQIKQDNTELIKQLKEADLQPNLTNNRDTRSDYID